MPILQLNTGIYSQRFSIGWGKVYTEDADYSGNITRINRCGNYQVWYKQSSGLSGPWAVLVKVLGDQDLGLAVEIIGYELNRSNSRRVKRDLVEACNKMGGTVSVYTPVCRPHWWDKRRKES